MALSKTAKILCAALLCLFGGLLLLGVGISVFLYPFEEPLRFGVGLATGIALSLIKVVLLEKALSHAADMGEGAPARNYSFLQAILRNALTVAVLLLAFLFPDIFGLWGTIAGLLSLQFAAYIAGFILRRDGTPV